jgi:hypothetical protein
MKSFIKRFKPPTSPNTAQGKALPLSQKPETQAKGTLFGVPLSVVMKSEDEDISVPRLICAMVEWMSHERFVKTEGLLRLAGSGKQVTQIRDLLDQRK